MKSQSRKYTRLIRNALRFTSFTLLLIISGALPSAPTPAVANNTVTSLSVAGFSVSWPQIMYMPTGCSRFEFKYTNGAPNEFLQVGFVLNDMYGDSVANDSLIGAPPGRSGVWDKQICGFSLKSGLGPYKIKAFIKDYDSRGGGTLEQYGEIYFVARPGSTTNTPAPTPALPAPNPPQTPSSPVTPRPSSSPETIEMDGNEESPSAILEVTKQLNGKFLISINSNLSEEQLVIIATKKGRKSVTFRATTSDSGDVLILTSRNLSGFTVSLKYEDENLDKKKIK